MDFDKSTPSPRAPRKGSDLCARVRAWIWLGAVRRTDPTLSYDSLDNAVFGDVDRRRAFWRIARTGQLPDWRHPARDFQLVDQVAALPGYEHTLEYFRSELWKTLKSQPMSREALESAKHRLMLRFGLVEADPDWMAYGARLGTPPKWLQPATPAKFADAMERITPSHEAMSLDWLALLCVLYRLAVHDVDLEICVLLRNLIRTSYRTILQALEIGVFKLFGEKEFEFLIEMRVIRSDFRAEPPAWAMDRAGNFVAHLSREHGIELAAPAALQWRFRQIATAAAYALYDLKPRASIHVLTPKIEDMILRKQALMEAQVAGLLEAGIFKQFPWGIGLGNPIDLDG